MKFNCDSAQVLSDFINIYYIHSSSSVQTYRAHCFTSLHGTCRLAMLVTLASVSDTASAPSFCYFFDFDTVGRCISMTLNTVTSAFCVAGYSFISFIPCMQSRPAPARYSHCVCVSTSDCACALMLLHEFYTMVELMRHPASLSCN